MKIVVLDGYTENPGDLSWEKLAALGELRVYDRIADNNEDMTIKAIEDAEAVFTNKTPITRKILEACPTVKFIGVLATGYNIVDCAAAAERNIPVCNIPAYSTASVTQLTLALLLEITHHVGHHSEAVHEGYWESSRDFCFWDYPLMELAGKTFGILGYGSIGQSVAKAAQALGMKVLVHSRTRRVPGTDYVDLDTLLAQSDVLSLHCPLFPETREIINRETIAKMKDGAILLNTGRGPLINEQDVADALNSGKLYAAGVDVVSAEPIRGDNPLLTAKNCIITPHIAWASREARVRLMDLAVQNLKAFREGSPINRVN